MEHVLQQMATMQVSLNSQLTSFAQNIESQTIASNERLISTTQLLGSHIQSTAQNFDTVSHLLQQIGTTTQRRPELKIEPPTFNGKGDSREWKRKTELIYEAKNLIDAEKLTWT